MSRTKVHRAWKAIVGRCGNPNNKSYHRYGGRGIKVCQRWLDSFEAFFSDVGFPPSPEHSIDRIDNDGDYEPGNVRWADKWTQARNKRNNLRVTIDGVTKCLAEWCEERGLNYGAISNRITRDGWEPSLALSVSIMGQK